MEFGKVHHPLSIDYTLPDTEPARVGPPVSPDALELRIGAPQWTQPAWKKWLGGEKGLAGYARLMNAVEMNTTFYAWPKAATLENWKRQVDADFAFCPKIPRRLSQGLGQPRSGEGLRRFAEDIALLEPCIGSCFLQLPESFAPGRGEELFERLRHWPAGGPRLSVECRHGAFFAPAAWERLTAALRELGHGLVVTDTPGRRDVLHTQATASWVMLRFAGCGVASIDEARLRAWGAQLERFARAGVQRIWVFLHLPQDSAIPPMAAWLAQRLEKPFSKAARHPLLINSLQNE